MPLRKRVRDILHLKNQKINESKDHHISRSHNIDIIGANEPSTARNLQSLDPPIVVASILNVPVPLHKDESAVTTQTYDENEPGKGDLESISQSNRLEPVAIGTSLWALAYNKLQAKNPDLVKRFVCELGIDTADAKDGGFNYRIDKVAQSALKTLEDEEAEKSNRKLGDTSEKIRKHFEETVKLVMASKDYISSAVAFNPYAALAWSGVSLVLPLLLNPTQEHTAAIDGLNYIANLMVIYRWQEKTYLHETDFKEPVIELYTSILEYQATLLHHTHQKSAKQYAKDVVKTYDWTSRMKYIQQKEACCRKVIDVIAAKNMVEWRNEERNWQYELLQQLRGDEERRNIRALYSNYQADKNVNPERVDGTCEWFLYHTNFLIWRESQKSSILWLSAAPGCGKSVLSKYLVDGRGEVLSVNRQPPILCYFFFKDGDADRMDGTKAICALLHQLIIQQPQLYRYAKEDSRNKNESFLKDLDALWAIFLKATRDSSCPEIICVLDALDECQKYSRESLTAKLVQLYSLRLPTDSSKPILKFLVTSRPEYRIIRDFHDLIEAHSEVRLDGDEESEQISREIDIVIKDRVEKLGSRMCLSESSKSCLRENLSSIPHRTYLWLYLTLDTITDKLELRKEDIAVIAKSIPKSVDEAYTNILNKSQDRARARRLLHIVLAAVRPLTLQEVNEAMAVEEDCRYHDQLDMWPTDVAKDSIRNICGLFLSVVDSRVYLIHQTAREFLIAEEHNHSSPALPASMSIPWKGSFHPGQSDLFLLKICILYLQLQDFEEKDTLSGLDVEDEDITDTLEEDLARLEQKYHLLSYAANHWIMHFDWAQSPPNKAMVEAVAFKICNTLSLSFCVWYRIYLRSRYPLDGPCLPFSNLLIVSYLGLDSVLELLLEQEDVPVDSSDPQDRTPLSHAAGEGHEAVVGQLLDRNAQVDLQNNFSRTPLSHAAGSGHEVVVRQLLDRNAQIDSQNFLGRTPLSYAAGRGYEAVVRQLLDRGAQVDLQSRNGMTPLSYAAERGNEAAARQLLDHNAQVDLQSRNGRTPLSYAADSGNTAIVGQLLDRNVQVNLQDVRGMTPISYAARKGHEAVVRKLLDRNAQLNLQDKYGRTSLSYAAGRLFEAVVIQLLERGARADLKDSKKRTPLDYAKMGKNEETSDRYQVVIKLLEERQQRDALTETPPQAANDAELME